MPDPDTGESVGGTPEPFDASGISAFSFKLDGPTIPTTLRFSVDGGDGVQYCTTKETKLMPLPADGVLTVKLDDLRAKCWESTAFANNDAPIAPRSSRSPGLSLRMTSQRSPSTSA